VELIRSPKYISCNEAVYSKEKGGEKA